VPGKDVDLVRAIADRLRQGGSTAERLRAEFGSLASPTRASTGWALVEALRVPPEFAADLDIRRENVPLRDVNFE